MKHTSVNKSTPLLIRMISIIFAISACILLIGFATIFVIFIAAIWNIDYTPIQHAYLAEIFIRMFVTSIITTVISLFILVAYYNMD